jgi:hypothetical protein
VDAFYDWNPGKRQFTPEQIRIAVDRLRSGGWLANAPSAADGGTART